MPSPPRTQPINTPNPAPASHGRTSSFPFLGDSDSGNQNYGRSFTMSPSPQAQNPAPANQGQGRGASNGGANAAQPKPGFANRSPRKNPRPRPTNGTIVAPGTIIPNYLEKGYKLLEAKTHPKQDNVSDYGATRTQWSEAAKKLANVTTKWERGHKRGSSSEDSGGERKKITAKPRLSPDQTH